MTQYIGHTNKIEDATSITVTSEATGFEKENAYDWFLYDSWKSTTSANQVLYMDFGSAVTMDCAGVVGGNFSTSLPTWNLQASTDNFSSSIVGIAGNFSKTDNSVDFRLFTSASYRYWRFQFYSLSDVVSVREIFLGECIALPHAPRLGFVSPKNAAEDDISNNMSDGGFNLGRSVYSEGSKFSIDMSKVDESWVDANWQTLYEAIRSHAFFYVWDQENRPTEAAFCWTDGKIKMPSYEAYATDPLMSFSIPCRGVVE